MRYHAIRITAFHSSLIKKLDTEQIVDWDEDRNRWFLIPENPSKPNFLMNDYSFYGRFGEERRKTHSTINIQVVSD